MGLIDLIKKDLKEYAKKLQEDVEINSDLVESLGKSFGLNKVLAWVAIIILFILMSYFHPSSETLVCDSNYSCTVEHTYFNHIKFSNHISFKPDYITCKNATRREGRRRYGLYTSRRRYGLYTRIILNDNLGNKTKPFIYYYKEGSSICESEKQYFNSYIAKPENKFVLESSCDPARNYLFWGILLFAYLFTLLYQKKFYKKIFDFLIHYTAKIIAPIFLGILFIIMLLCFAVSYFHIDFPI